MRIVVVAAVLAGLVATPAMARPLCDADDNDAGVHVEFGISIGKRDTETQQQIDKMELKRLGVDAVSTRRTTDGCIEAQVRNSDGSWNVQYYDEDTLELAYD